MPVKYELIEHPEAYHDKHWVIKIMEGELEGVAFQYDTVKFREEDSGDVVLDFDVLYVENGERLDPSEESTSKVLGDILVDIIETNLREMDDGNGNIDTEASAE